MGAADSKLEDQITTVSRNRKQVIDPCLETLQALKAAGPLLATFSADSGLKEMLVQQPSRSQSTIDNLALDSTATAHLLELYNQWQSENVTKISKRQEGLGYKIEGVEALSMKLLQRLTNSASVMNTTAVHLSEVNKLHADVKAVKQNVQSAIESYESLRKLLNEMGPEFARNNSKPLLSQNPNDRNS